MEIQWTEPDPETGQKRYICAERFARAWRFKVRLIRREPWRRDLPVTKAMWETLLEALERRYQRREGVEESDLKAVRKIIANWQDAPVADGVIHEPGEPTT